LQCRGRGGGEWGVAEVGDELDLSVNITGRCGKVGFEKKLEGVLNARGISK